MLSPITMVRNEPAGSGLAGSVNVSVWPLGLLNSGTYCQVTLTVCPPVMTTVAWPACAPVEAGAGFAPDTINTFEPPSVARAMTVISASPSVNSTVPRLSSLDGSPSATQPTAVLCCW